MEAATPDGAGNDPPAAPTPQRVPAPKIYDHFMSELRKVASSEDDDNLEKQLALIIDGANIDLSLAEEGLYKCFEDLHVAEGGVEHGGQGEEKDIPDGDTDALFDSVLEEA